MAAIEAAAAGAVGAVREAHSLALQPAASRACAVPAVAAAALHPQRLPISLLHAPGVGLGSPVSLLACCLPLASYGLPGTVPFLRPALALHLAYLRHIAGAQLAALQQQRQEEHVAASASAGGEGCTAVMACSPGVAQGSPCPAPPSADPSSFPSLPVFREVLPIRLHEAVAADGDCRALHAAFCNVVASLRALVGATPLAPCATVTLLACRSAVNVAAFPQAAVIPALLPATAPVDASVASVAPVGTEPAAEAASADAQSVSASASASASQPLPMPLPHLGAARVALGTADHRSLLGTAQDLWAATLSSALRAAFPAPAGAALGGASYAGAGAGYVMSRGSALLPPGASGAAAAAGVQGRPLTSLSGRAFALTGLSVDSLPAGAETLAALARKRSGQASHGATPAASEAAPALVAAPPGAAGGAAGAFLPREYVLITLTLQAAE
jgi:hypothetical protein